MINQSQKSDTLKLFLPQIHQTQEIEAVLSSQRIAYVGDRKKILVVDNEYVDREMLVTLLEPLGFEMAEAANGLDCLEKHISFKPDLILMDLAMPMMDGWEASYVIRKVRQSEVPIGIVSANAFDKGLENSAGIGAEDFILKPVELSELLDWLGKQLHIEWILAPELDVTASLEAPSLASELVMPPKIYLDELLALIKMGYVRGISKKIDEIEGLNDEYKVFAIAMRQFAQQFQLAAMQRFVEEFSSHE